MAEAHADFWQTMPKWRRQGPSSTVSLGQRRAVTVKYYAASADEFYRAMVQYLLIIATAVPLFALQDFVEERLVLAWRAYLTDVLLSAFFRGSTYFRVVHMAGVDNPDQRISQDVATFVASSTMLGFGVIQKASNCAAFVGVLWSISPRLVMLLLLYTGIGTWLTTSLFGRKLMSLQYTLLKQEADLRFALVRVREHCEAIAFFRGHAAEAANTGAAFGDVVRTRRIAITWTALLAVWRNLYTYSTLLVPSLITAPQYFAGEVQFGVVTQAGYSFARIENALSFVVASMESFSGLATGTDRLYSLFTALNLSTPTSPSRGHSILSTLLLIPPPSSAHNKDKDKDEDVLPEAAPAGDRKPLLEWAKESGGWVSGGDGSMPERDGEVMRRGLDAGGPEGVLLRISRLHVRAPSLRRRGLADLGAAVVSGGGWEKGYLVADDLGLTVTRGMTVLLMGPSGCGKSSLLRVIAGLWTHGSGEIACVSGKDAFFLPQKPYMPLGSLRQQLVFPEPETAADCTDESDAALRKLAASVCLPRVADAATNLSAVESWGEVLSVGEQQRVAFLRLLRAAPALAFLDEATSAMDVVTEHTMYSLLRQHCGSFVSVGHRPQLEQYHSHVLTWVEPGRWQLRPSATYDGGAAEGQ